MSTVMHIRTWGLSAPLGTAEAQLRALQQLSVGAAPGRAPGWQTAMQQLSSAGAVPQQTFQTCVLEIDVAKA